ncbi:LysR family transcriptional regulator [Brevibacillus sp. B_LB10_24]|uniref:LysR family transcriptional regulator n=1 Tax=Brevibacillus sp. B_LB10_24 TaxID=3380645 RepID=UPI0038BD87B9
MNLHALRIFTEVANQGSVTRAAEALLLSQPAVTAQVRRLEAEVGLTLLTPQGRGVQLTEAGELLARHAQRLFAMEKEIEQRLQALKEGTSGRLRVAATNLPTNLLLPVWLAKFKREHPGIQLELVSGNSREVFERLLSFEADLAVVAGGWEAEGVLREVLFEDELWFIVPVDHKYAGRLVPLADMMKEPFLLRGEGSSTRQMLISLCIANNVEPPVVGLQFYGMYESIRSVISGYGAMLVPALAAREYVERGDVAIVHVEGVKLNWPISLCQRKADPLSPAAARFIGWIKPFFAANKKML